jgi:hypothetical protein
MKNTITIDPKKVLGRTSKSTVMAGGTKPVGVSKPVGTIKPTGIVKPQ